MGGDAAAVAKLETFFTQLNATRYAPYDWSGNEPGEWAPWLFDYLGAPAQTQRVVRATADTEYADAPVDEPGNDDLGAIASWCVWAAVGLFPVTPGAADLALASPLFPTVSIVLPDGRRLDLRAPGAAASRPYVHALTVTGVSRPATRPTGCSTPTAPRPSADSWDRPWLPASVIKSGGTLTYTLSGTPDPAWASSAASSPPSFGGGAIPAVGYSFPSGTTAIAAGQPTAVQLGVVPAVLTATSVDWQASPLPSGLQLTPSSGSLDLASSGAAGTCSAASAVDPITESLTLTAASAGSYTLRIVMHTSGGQPLPPVDLVVQASAG